MSHSSNNNPPHGSRSPFTLEDGVTFWRARDVYRVRRGLYSVVILFLLVETFGFAARGRWDLVLTVVGFQVGTLWALAWLLRQAWAWVRGRWHGLVVILMFCTLSSGCADMALTVARIHGYKGDPYASPCTPASFQAGTCVTTKEGGK